MLKAPFFTERLPAESQFAVRAAFCDSFVKFQGKSHDLRYTPVPVHSHVAQQLASFIVKPQFLPGAHQGAAVKIHAEGVPVSADWAHIKGFFYQIAQKGISEIPTISRIGATFFDILTVDPSAAFYGPPDNGLGVYPGFYHFVIDKGHPGGPVFNLRPVDFRGFGSFVHHIPDR
jgi:hypothetical protein